MQIVTFLDLCSGIGGGRLGLEQAGLRSIGYCDTSRLAVTTYQMMFDVSEEKKYSNLKRIKTTELPQYDMLIAGFPCQTFSVMGRKDGFSDDRGQIIFHIARILEESQPPCFLLENVKGLVTHDKGKTLSVILDELRRVGYHTTYKVLTSLEHGVPQMRQRVYFVGIRKDLTDTIDDFVWPEKEETPKLEEYLIDRIPATDERLEILKYYLNNPTNNGKYTIDDLRAMNGKVLDTRMNDLRIYEGKVPTLRAQRDGILYVYDNVIYQLTGYEALLLQGFPKEYANKVKDIVSDRHLLMQAGNAMTVNVIKEIGSAIKKYIENKEESKMTGWEKFELDCTDYLNHKFGKFAIFEHQGGSDSTVPDIRVTTKSGKDFYIEAKQCPAQCGQFVLLPDLSTKTFQYSRLNATAINRYSQMIINHMNEYFEEFKEAGTAGKDIIMPEGSSIFADWIIQTYKNKGVRYFITNNYTIVPIDKFLDYFTVTAKYRIKRSGSNNVGLNNMDDVNNHIKKIEYGITSQRTADDKLFVSSTCNLHKVRFIINGTEYMFSKREGEYEIRRLSNTFNANVIFSIDLNSSRSGISDEEFICILK